MARLSPQELYNNYRKGFSGCLWEQHIFDHLMENSKYPMFGDAIGSRFKSSGKGKLSTPFKSVLKFDKKAYEERQTTGDCLIKGTQILMSDGSLKNIEDITIGEKVITHNNRPRIVYELINKQPTTQQINHIYIKKYNKTLSITNDHKMLVFKDHGYEWVEAKNLKEGDLLVLPKRDFKNVDDTKLDLSSYISDLEFEATQTTLRIKNSKNTLPRFIRLSTDLMWLFGLYAAEGGIDGQNKERITFNLHIKETQLRDRIIYLLQNIFGAKCTIFNRISQNVCCVRCSNTVVARVFSHFIAGNQWSKSINRNIINSSEFHKLAFLRGWSDGDGSVTTEKRRKLVGVSVSQTLINNISEILISLQIQHTITTRSPRNASKTAYQVDLYGDQVYKIYPELSVMTKVHSSKQNALTCSLGLLAPISKIINEVYTDNVYCINVEDDHSFVANGFISHNCVSHGTRNATDISRAVEIDIGGEKEAWIARGATEAIYGARGHGGQGMSCARAAEFVSKNGGIVLRQNYKGIADFSKYNGNLGAGWGGRGLPDPVIDLANDHQIRTVSLVQTIEEARDALANGYGLAVCSNYGFSNKRDKKGISNTSGSWAHCYTSNSMVLTPNGYKPIDSFFIGEKVFNHKGLIDSVSHIFERDYIGDMITIKSWGLPEFSLTNEHPLLISRNITDDHDEIYDEESDGGILVIKKRKVKTKIRKLMWVNAEDIIDSDWLVTPKIKYEAHKFSGLNYIGISNRIKNIPNQLSSPNDDVAWMFGLYIADGNSVKDHKICFTFSINQTSYVDRLKKAFDILGLNIIVSYHDTHIRVKCYSSVLAKSFDQWFGHYSTERQIPEFLLTDGWNLESLIDGIFCGDGFYAKGIQKISMSNKPLIFQLRHILANLDYTPTIFEQKRGDSSYHNGSSCYTLAWGSKYSKLTKDNSYLYNPVRELKKSTFNGKVYNLEVKNEHSYIVDGVGSHNCMAWIACDDTGSEPLFLVQNSWGKWNDGGHPEWGPIPDGSFLIRAEVAAGMLAANGSYAFSNFDGFPVQKLPDYGFDYLN